MKEKYPVNESTDKQSAGKEINPVKETPGKQLAGKKDTVMENKKNPVKLQEAVKENNCPMKLIPGIKEEAGKDISEKERDNERNCVTHHANFLTSSRHPRRVKFDMEAHFNPTKGNLREKIGVT